MLITFFVVIVEVTGPRGLENGLVVPGKFTASTKSAAIGQKLKEKILHIKELCKHMARMPACDNSNLNGKETVLLDVQ